MADTPKKQGPGPAAKRGKVKGTGVVTPKAADQEAQEASKLAPDTKPGETADDLDHAYNAGVDASKRGTPSRPPLGYSTREVKAWYAGYKSHANPDNDTKVEDITDGYRGNY